ADQEEVAAAGGEGQRVETAGQLRRDLGLDAVQLFASEPGGFRGAHLGAGQAGVEFGPKDHQRRAGGAGLQLPPLRTATGRVLLGLVLGVTVAEEIEHELNLRGRARRRREDLLAFAHMLLMRSRISIGLAIALIAALLAPATASTAGQIVVFGTASGTHLT